MIKPLFILSLPRSGSTLLQRVLAADRQIASVTEPWVLLPLVYALKEQGVRAAYDHSSARKALKDFCLELPHGTQDYWSAIGTAMCELYRKAAKDSGALYFLDKTPRYALIAKEMFDIFPDGKWIVLWRNPLAVIASMIETWGDGTWNLSEFQVDLYSGLANLIDCYQSHSNKILAIQYENFLRDPNLELSRIAEYLGITLDEELLSNFSHVQFRGEMGDPTGIKNYTKVSAAPLEKWKVTLNNPLRKAWCRRYLRWIGEDRLKLMGYDLNELCRELDSIRMSLRHVVTDCFKMTIWNDRTRTYIKMFGQTGLK